MKLYDQCLLFFLHNSKKMDITFLPRTILSDINILMCLNHALSIWKTKCEERELIRRNLEEWQYTEECMIVYCEFTCGDCRECEYWEEIQDHIIMYERKMQDIDMKIGNLESVVNEARSNIPPHLSSISTYIEYQFNY